MALTAVAINKATRSEYWERVRRDKYATPLRDVLASGAIR